MEKAQGNSRGSEDIKHVILPLLCCISQIEIYILVVIIEIDIPID
jgi:hypothetical protein